MYQNKHVKQKKTFCWVQISQSRPEYIASIYRAGFILKSSSCDKETIFNSKTSFSFNSGLYLQCSAWLAQSTTGWSHSPIHHHKSQAPVRGDLLIQSNTLTVIVHSVLIQVPCIGTISITGGDALSNQPPPSLIITPPVSSGWFRAPAPSPPLECSPWARPSARSGPLSPLGSPEISRSSTWGFSAQNLKQGPQKVVSEGRNTYNAAKKHQQE